MTSQSYERILIDGEEQLMAKQPLSNYLYPRSSLDFHYQDTSCKRGYIGTWEIRDKKLFIISLRGSASILDDNGNRKEGVNCLTDNEIYDYLFPDTPTGTFAEWYTGELRVALGKQLLGVNSGYSSIYEKDRFFQITNGCVTEEHEVENSDRYEELTEVDVYLMNHPTTLLKSREDTT